MLHEKCQYFIGDFFKLLLLRVRLSIQAVRVAHQIQDIPVLVACLCEFMDFCQGQLMDLTLIIRKDQTILIFQHFLLLILRYFRLLIAAFLN